MDYTKLSLVDVRAALDDIARETQATFGRLGEHQLNWRPDATRWSVAQCLEHLLVSNRLIFSAAGEALAPSAPRTIWQRLPVLPGLFGQLLIRSQAPGGTRKYRAAPDAQPSASNITADIVQRFVAQQWEAATFLQTLDEQTAGRVIITSPFVRFMTYSMLDACRLVVAHGRRHFEQARRVTEMPGFPAA
jgi:uncharacterized damage-inducible protein DinB